MTGETGRAATGGRGLRVGILGELTATNLGRPLGLGGRRQRAVLALLVLARGRIVTTDQLIDALWDQAPPPSAVGALHAYVSHLRCALEPDRAAKNRNGFIVREGIGYAFRVADEAVDAWRFERALGHAATLAAPAEAAATLRAALNLWHGAVLVGYAEESWAAPEAARLTELREVARERLLAARLNCGESDVLVHEAEALVAQHPLREERWRLLVLALYRSHRQADALGALRRARELLARELGIDPGPVLNALEADVLAQSPARMRLLAGQPALIPLTPPVEPPLAGQPRPRTPDDLVDRDRELFDLRDCVAGLLAGEPGLVLVEGPAGIGKSRLLAEVRRLAGEHNVLTLRARGSRRRKEYGFGIVRQLLEHVVAGSSSPLLTGAAAPAGGVLDDGAAASGRGPNSFAVFHGLYRIVVTLAAERPVLLSVDDLQWCDAASLHFLAYLVRRLEGLPVLIATTVRTGEPHPDDAALAELAHDPAAVHVRPTPLSAGGVASLVHRRLGEPADSTFAAACHRATSGNPLLLHQLLRALEADGVQPHSDQVGTVTELGSRAVSSLVLTRLVQLPPAATTVARVIAVLGDGAELPAVAKLTGLSESAAADAIAPLVRAEVIGDRYPLGFVHPLIGDAVYRDLPPDELQLYHERAARTLTAAGAMPERIAAQLLSGPVRPISVGEGAGSDARDCKAVGALSPRGGTPTQPPGCGSVAGPAMIVRTGP